MLHYFAFNLTLAVISRSLSLKFVSHRWDASYEELTRLVNVPMLGERRLHLKLVQVYKIFHGLCDFPDDILQIQWHIQANWPGHKYCVPLHGLTIINTYLFSYTCFIIFHIPFCVYVPGCTLD